MGMNSVDLFSATDYKNGYIKYNRTKTKDRRSDEAYIEVKVHPFIMPLMRKYAGTKTIFNFCSRYNDYEGFNKNLNIGLKKVGKSVGISDLEFYQARHTFATLSRNLMKFSKGDVDEALNHVGSFEVADIYIAKDFSIINDNRPSLLACYRRDARTSSSSKKSSKRSLLRCIVFSMGQPNTPESNISGFGRADKEQARPLFMGVFTR